VPILNYVLVAIAAYLLGSIPTGFLVAQTRGIDIRAVGSGNIGATNSMRVLGKPAGVFVLLMDVLKGYAGCAFLPPLMFNWLAPHSSGLFRYFHDQPPEVQMRFYVVAGIFAVLGHNYTCWLGFKGGKGIATSGGVFIALTPLAAVVALACWIVAFALFRYASVASIVAAIALPTTVWLTANSLTLQIVTTALGLLAIFKHRSNIKRLLNGTEQRFGQKSSPKEATK
jgi:acyl phosphate:glycerol-3-phosphate acyltransferase